MLYLLLLIPPFLFASGNFIDQYLIHKSGKKRTQIMVISLTSALMNLLLLPILYFFVQIWEIQIFDRFLLTLAGLLYIISLWPYLLAMTKTDTSLISVYWQLLPIINIIVWYLIFHELPSTTQRIWVFILFLSVCLISIDFTSKISFRRSVLWLMALSSIWFALQEWIFRYMSGTIYGFRGPTFREYLGAGIIAIILFFTPKVRKAFIETFQTWWTWFVVGNVINESIYIIATKCLQYTMLLIFFWFATLIDNSIQPVFAIIIGIILTKLRPKVFKEDLSKVALIQKGICIFLIFIGMRLLK